MSEFKHSVRDTFFEGKVNDEQYKAVCHEIRAAKYPQDLIEAYPEAGTEQKNQIRKWFQSKTKLGETAARMFADTYIMLSQGDLSDREIDTKTRSATRTPKSAAPTKATGKSESKKPAPQSPDLPLSTSKAESHQGNRRLPSVHIDVQVHISPDTTPEQIDRIFASMSKHLGSYIN